MASVAKAITQTLVASTATDDTITGLHQYVSVTNQTSGTVVYVSFGPTAPTVAGNDCFCVIGGDTVTFARAGVGASAGTQIRMISAGTPVVTIAGRVMR